MVDIHYQLISDCCILTVTTHRVAEYKVWHVIHKGKELYNKVGSKINKNIFRGH